VLWRTVVRAHRNVTCGVDAGRPEFAAFDTDICRAVAAALFDDPEAIVVLSENPTTLAALLTAGDIDLYLGPIDRTLADQHVGPTLFVDATGAMARTDVGIRSIFDLKFATVCLIQDSIDAQLFNAEAAAARVEVQPFLFNAGDGDAMYQTYDQGRCDAIVDNRARLAQRRVELGDPRNQGLIDLTLPIGLRGPITAARDANWSEIVALVGNSLIRAEELGVTSTNLEDMLASDDPAIRQLLGVEGGTPAGLGLTNDYVVRILRGVGNYGEIYDRNFGAESGLDLPRDVNALASDGGQIAAP
jgi:general L-amino acid transport system substrate-binding protein